MPGFIEKLTVVGVFGLSLVVSASLVWKTFGLRLGSVVMLSGVVLGACVATFSRKARVQIVQPNKAAIAT